MVDGPAPRTCAVLGSPIAHSLSPVLHRAAYRELDLDWTYERHEIAEHELAGFVAGRRSEWRGLSLTMPLKFVAMELGEPDELAQLVGAANTMLLDDPLTVHNTDVPGLTDAVRAAGVPTVERAVVLGSGATARSTIASLGLLGCRTVTVLARSRERAEALRPLTERCGVELRVADWDDPVPQSDLLVSTVTAGAADGHAEAAAASAPVVFDVLYDPWPTPLAVAAARRESVVLNGLDLLAHQAVGQVRLMTGRDVAAEVLLSAGRAALGTGAAAVKD